MNINPLVIRLYMLVRGIPSMAALARKAGVSRDALYNMLADQSVHPEVLERLAATLGCHPVEFLEGPVQRPAYIQGVLDAMSDEMSFLNDH